MSVKVTMAMRQPIAKRKVVSRFFYEGKGYANRGSLYRALAKKMLRTMVADSARDRTGSIPEIDGIDSESPTWKDDERRAWDEIFSRHFPHTDDCHKCEGGCAVDWNYDYSEFKHRYKSCRVAQRLWLIDKANELRAYDDQLAKPEPTKATQEGV